MARARKLVRKKVFSGFQMFLAFGSIVKLVWPKVGLVLCYDASVCHSSSVCNEHIPWPVPALESRRPPQIRVRPL